MQYDDTPWLLEQWGRWAWTGHGLNLNFPAMTPFRRLTKTGSAPAPMISDLAAQEVDAAVARVCADDRNVGRAVVHRYLLKWSYGRIARDLGCCRQHASKLCKIGEAAVSELLED